MPLKEGEKEEDPRMFTFFRFRTLCLPIQDVRVEEAGQLMGALQANVNNIKNGKGRLRTCIRTLRLSMDLMTDVRA